MRLQTKTEKKPESDAVYVVVTSEERPTEDHRCYFFCCRCCHIATICVILLSLGLVGSAYNVVATSTLAIIRDDVRRLLFCSKLIAGKTLASTVVNGLGIGTSIAALVGIRVKLAGLVIPHIGLILVNMVVKAMVAIVFSVLWFFNPQLLREELSCLVNDDEQVDRELAKWSVIGTNLSMVSAIIVGAWLIHLFRCLQRYLRQCEMARITAATTTGRGAE